MAWRNGARLTGKHIKSMNKRWHALRPENPHGVPKAVMKQLAADKLPAGAINARLQELLNAYNQKG
jgi:hypothetical protein